MTSPEFVNFIKVEFESLFIAEYEIFLSCSIFSNSAMYLSSLPDSSEKGRITGLIKNGLRIFLTKKMIMHMLIMLITRESGISSLANFLRRFLFLLRAFLSVSLDDKLDNFFSGVILYQFFCLRSFISFFIQFSNKLRNL